MFCLCLVEHKVFFVKLVEDYCKIKNFFKIFVKIIRKFAKFFKGWLKFNLTLLSTFASQTTTNSTVTFNKLFSCFSSCKAGEPDSDSTRFQFVCECSSCSRSHQVHSDVRCRVYDEQLSWISFWRSSLRSKLFNQCVCHERNK